jgi:hypothetical protein
MFGDIKPKNSTCDKSYFDCFKYLLGIIKTCFFKAFFEFKLQNIGFVFNSLKETLRNEVILQYPLLPQHAKANRQLIGITKSSIPIYLLGHKAYLELK